MKKLLLSILILCLQNVYSQIPQIKFSDNLKKNSYRSLSVVSDSIIWAGGSNGTICRSIDGAKTFICNTIPGADSTDFRSIYAFSKYVALAGNTGSPAKIFRTTDGGANWDTVYENNNTKAFIDGIDFWDEKNGICFGDPINNKLMILLTADGGKSWNEIPPFAAPETTEGEASFAASGTTIKCMAGEKVIIATGGNVSRLLVSDDRGHSWYSLTVPILQGHSSTGIFSFDFLNNLEGIVVGGDYKNETNSTKQVYYTLDGGKNWLTPLVPTNGYRECVQFVNKTTAITVGPTGIEITYDKGNHWHSLSDKKGMHVIKKARDGNKIFLSGIEGRFGEIILP